MKKARNFMLVALVGLTFATMSSVAGTYAKYTENGTSTDNARVAKFGVTISSTDATANTLFTKGDGEFVANTEDLVAPGTKGTLAGFTISGTPEVAVDANIEAVLELENWTLANGTEYMPLIFTIGTEDYYIGKDGITTVADLITAVQDAIGVNAQYKVGEAISATMPTVSYRWDYEADTNLTNNTQNDANDTVLGNNTTAPTVNLTVTATVTQIEKPTV